MTPAKRKTTAAKPVSTETRRVSDVVWQALTKSVNMIPRLPRNHKTNKPAASPEQTGKLFLREALLAFASNVPDRISRQLGMWLSLPTSVPIFGDHISGIISRSSEKKMGWINAKPIVARVANEHAIGDLAIGDFPCNTMGKQRLSVAGCNSPIAGPDASDPNNTPPVVRAPAKGGESHFKRRGHSSSKTRLGAIISLSPLKLGWLDCKRFSALLAGALYGHCQSSAGVK